MERLILIEDYSPRADHPKAGDKFKVLDYEMDDYGHVFCYYCESLGDGKSYVLYPDEVEELIE